MKLTGRDPIKPFTRVVAALVVPFLLLAFVILYFFPEQSGDRFAWEIQPNIMAMFMGAGYLGGSWLFVNAIFGRHWHRVAPGFAPVTSFTIAMALATFLHWERFDTGHLPFVLWLILYVITPLLVPLTWWLNRRAISGAPLSNEPVVPLVARLSLRLLGLLILGFAIAGFVQPEWLIGIWVWQLTPLTARILSGWFALLGVGGLTISREKQWSAWQVGLQAIGLWHLLVVIAAFFNPSDFVDGLANWYLISVIAVLIGMVGLHACMARFAGAR